MTLEDLRQRLLEDGYGPPDGLGPLVWSGPGLIEVGGLRLRKEEGEITIGWTERDEWIGKELVTRDEDEACRFFYNRISQTYLGSSAYCFADKAEADALANALNWEGVQVRRDDLPAGCDDARRYRLFIKGHDLNRARAIRAARPTALDPLRRRRG